MMTCACYEAEPSDYFVSLICVNPLSDNYSQLLDTVLRSSTYSVLHLIACAAQEFDAATGLPRAKKLMADLAHTEAEKARVAHEAESLKVSL